MNLNVGKNITVLENFKHDKLQGSQLLLGEVQQCFDLELVDAGVPDELHSGWVKNNQTTI